MQPNLNYQLYTLEHGLSRCDQRAYDASAGEFAAALSEYWVQRARRRRCVTIWPRRSQRIRVFHATTRHSPTH